MITKSKFPSRIIFDTNPDLCNLNCIMCDNNSIYKKTGPSYGLMDFTTIKKTLDSIGSVLKEITPSTMGEPLLYPQFIKLVELCKERQIKMNITTNGTFPKHSVEEWADILLPSLSHMVISINGVTDKTAALIMTGINIEAQKKNIISFVHKRNLYKEKTGIEVPITLQITCMESNFHEIKDIYKFGHDIGVNKVKGHHLWVVWDEMKEQSLKRNSLSIDRWNNLVNELEELKKNLQSNTLLGNFDKINIDTVKSYGECPLLGQMAWIAWDGTFNVCCCPDDLRKNFGNFGNVNTTDFMELWNSDFFTQFVENWGNYENCKQCNMRREIKK